VPSSNAIPFHASLQEEWDITLPDETLFRCEPTDPPRLISIGASVNWITGWQKQELEDILLPSRSWPCLRIAPSWNTYCALP
jgi:hypothetical protein